LRMTAIAELLVHMLLDGGYLVQHAAKGLRAWDILCSSPLDLVITDVMMPGMDGVALMGKCERRQRCLPS
jgi:CheY-like chemotaxis protein